MMESIRQFFMANMAEPATEVDKDLPADLRLAACALLLELAYADDDFTEVERVHLEGAIRRQFGLDEEQSAELIELAEEQRAGAVDLWTFTNLVAEHYSLGQKMVLAEAMWGLVFSDGELASREDYLMRKISGLLRLEPGYLAEAKKRVEDHRSLDDGLKAASE
ncbi:MAG: TerB family tellurite resistance protein [Longimicrobiales bacterium]|nr:TerB family tellurite resistance protein [Longimicrobiales bacterium]